MASASGSTLSDIYSSAQRVRLELTSDLERLEQLEMRATTSTSLYGGHGGGVGYGGANWVASSEIQVVSPRRTSAATQVSAEMVHEMRTKLGNLVRMCSEMDSLWRSHFNRAQRELWRRKVEHLNEEAEVLRMALEKYIVREGRRQKEADERAELVQARGEGGGKRILSEFERDQTDLDTAKRANRLVEDTISQGLATLANMAQHREMLKGAQRKALDILNYVGLSDTVLKKISRRQYVDKAIAYGGMALIVFIIFIMWLWSRSK